MTPQQTVQSDLRGEGETGGDDAAAEDRQAVTMRARIVLGCNDGSSSSEVAFIRKAMAVGVYQMAPSAAPLKPNQFVQRRARQERHGEVIAGLDAADHGFDYFLRSLDFDRWLEKIEAGKMATQ